MKINSLANVFFTVSIALTIPLTITIYSGFSGTVDLSLNNVGHLKIQGESVKRF
jgi:hypothetical protein